MLVSWKTDKCVKGTSTMCRICQMLPVKNKGFVTQAVRVFPGTNVPKTDSLAG